jgi:hypothetical protein
MKVNNWKLFLGDKVKFYWRNHKPCIIIAAVLIAIIIVK